MAMHGEIKVNGEIIGTWSAVNKGGEPLGICRYDWAATINGESHAGAVKHYRPHGATALLVKIMSEVTRQRVSVAMKAAVAESAGLEADRG